MKKRSQASSGEAWPPGLDRFAVVLVRPDSPENIGLAARGMANTGFSDLRIVGLDRLEAPAFRTAIHADAILDGARFFGTLAEALDGLPLVCGSTARVRREFPLSSLRDAVRTVLEYPPETRVGLVFGNERTGLTAEEIGLTNIRFRIPQAARQPSYNLGVAVTLTLFEIAGRGEPAPVVRRDSPLTRAEQEEAGRRFGEMLDGLGFMRDTNRDFITGRVQDIFRRMALTGKDRDVILAMFRRGLLGRPEETRPQGVRMASHEIKVVFGGGLKVNAEYKGFLVQTDQPLHQGGGGTAPAPFDYFLVSLATCAGFYALEFCRAREIPTDKLAVTMTAEKGAVSKMIDQVTIHVGLPPGFPDKYRGPIVKAIDHCTVKAHILRPPQFEIVAEPAE